MASNYSSSSIFFAPTRKSQRRTRTIRFVDETHDDNANADANIPEPPSSPKDIAAADLKLAMELQREENMLALQEAAKRRDDQIQAGRNRTGRSCAHGFGLGTRGVACHADRDLIAEQQESERAEAEAGAVEVKFVADETESSDCGDGDAADDSKTDADTHSTCPSDASSMEGSTPTRRPRGSRRTRQSSSGVAAMRGVAPPLGYRLNSGLTENPRSSDDEDEEDDRSESSQSSPLRPTTNTHMDTPTNTNEESGSHCYQDCSSASSSSFSTPTKRNTSSHPQHDYDYHTTTSSHSSVHTSPARNTTSMPTPPPSILRNRLTKRPPSDLNLVGRVGTADTVDTLESTEAATTPTPTSSASTTGVSTPKQPVWLEEMEKERALKKNAEDTGKAAQKLLADAMRHSDSARRRSGFGLFAPTWGAKGSPGRSGGGTVSYDRRNLPTTY